MACAAPSEPDDRASNEVRAQTKVSEQAAYLVIDVTASRVESANAAGRMLLGLAPTTSLPAALDSIMPALQRLRHIAAGEPPRDRETLTFWSNGRLATMICTVMPVNSNGSKHLMQLTQLDQTPLDQSGAGLTAPTAPQAVMRDELPVPAEEALPPIKPRDDAETLREIARRIREGQTAKRGIAVPTSPESQNQPETAPHPTRDTQNTTVPSALRTLSEAPSPATLAQLAHELKTPLSAIVAASEIMRDQRLGPMDNDLYLEYASDIHESARHGLAVITGMLDAAANGSSRQTEAFDLNELTVATMSAMQPLAHAKGLKLAHETDEGRLEILANATAIRQIILNLLTNAMKFTGSGGEIHTGTGYLADGAIYLVVRDTGEGMDEDMLARAFYEESDEMKRRPGGGYGLGLPMVRRLAEANRGTIEIDSAPGKGTVVLISFPTRR